MREDKLTGLIKAKVAEATADVSRKLEENKDPLQSFCQENPETDECRIYEA
ncbi:hypothetical protein HanXRQr2_Chr17g0798101 [Helianthus annuus]|uniref:CP12 domain-containing protein n=1 Tax=Helianthus annuus TaxID=4232 RepID=A0A9K3DGP5_HELAN|nr:hypothetical protein HanXRQr2_Chr17g0798101 [Helianthus annuus]KAJ0428833.1 putative calvin cycle protein CP12 [Helianthus annuus]KAJ0635961.1 putative calvin cycle protein CP12 [Helianthus annuus]